MTRASALTDVDSQGLLVRRAGVLGGFILRSQRPCRRADASAPEVVVPRMNRPRQAPYGRDDAITTARRFGFDLRVQR